MYRRGLIIGGAVVAAALGFARRPAHVEGSGQGDRRRSYGNFSTVAGAVLDMMAAMHGKMLSVDDRNRILQGTLSLPPHPDVKDCLQRLKAAGFRMVTLTNSAPTSVTQQLKKRGLTEFFDDHAPFPVGPTPDTSSPDLGAAADRIIAAEPR